MTRSYVVTALVGAAMVSLVAHAIVVGRLSHLTAAMLAFAGLFLAVKLIQLKGTL